MRGRNERGDRGDLARRPEWRADTDPPVAASDSSAGEGARPPFTLPPDLASKSLAPGTILLPLDAALQAIARAAEQGARVQNWEGWVKLHDGSRVKSLEHGGSFALSRDTARAAQQSSDAIRHAQSRFDREPEYPDSQLYFGLTFAA